MTLGLKQATIEDVETLARMNKHLIEDEGHRNPMNVSQLVERMVSFLSGEYGADLILDDGRVVGYALYRFQRDDLTRRFQSSISGIILLRGSSGTRVTAGVRFNYSARNNLGRTLRS